MNEPIPFLWRQDWFPIDHYVRFCMETKYVDTGDIFFIACASKTAAKSANSAYLGQQKLETTARMNGFDPGVLRYVRWNHTRSDRKMLPIDCMKNIIGNMTTATAKKLLPEFTKLVDDINNDRKIPQLVEYTSTMPLALQTSAEYDLPTGTMITSGSSMIVPNIPLPDAPYSAADVQINLWKNCASVCEIARTECGNRNKFKCEQELALAEHTAKMAEHTAKKKKVELQSHYDDEVSRSQAEHALCKLKLKQIEELKLLATEFGADERKAELDKLSDDFWEKVKNEIMING